MPNECSADNCHYPNCKNKIDTIHIKQDKKLGLCNKHEELYIFIHKVQEYDEDWGF
jgi:hypothetical protein